VRYPSAERAQRALVVIQQQRDTQRHAGPLEQRAYWCPRCGWHHLTHEPQRRPAEPAGERATPTGGDAAEPNASRPRDARSN